MSNDGWEIVSPKKRSKGKRNLTDKQRKQVHLSMKQRLQDIEQENTAFNELTDTEKDKSITIILSKLIPVLNEYKENKVMSSFVDQVLSTSKSMQGEDKVYNKIDIICYGIGQFKNNIITQLQLCALLQMKESFSSCLGECWIHDPLLTRVEQCVLERLGFTYIKHNEQGKRAIRADADLTVFYLPHCGEALSDNILWANWGININNIILISNSITTSLDKFRANVKPCTLYCGRLLRKYMTEHEISESGLGVVGVLNDICVHSWNLPIGEAYWNNMIKPDMQCFDDNDAEII